MALGHSPKVVTNGLVAYWDIGNIKTTTGFGVYWRDLSGNGLTMTTTGFPTWSTGNLGNYAFDGATQYATAANSTLLDNQTFTIEVWAKTNATTQNGFWFEKGNVNTQYALFQEGALIKCRVNVGTLIDTITPTTASFINTTDWFQVAFTFVTGSQVCYVNGNSIGTGTTTGTLATNAGGMSIGVYGGTGTHGYFYSGNIASVKVYSRVLTPLEMKQNYNALRGRFGL